MPVLTTEDERHRRNRRKMNKKWRRRGKGLGREEGEEGIKRRRERKG